MKEKFDHDLVYYIVTDENGYWCGRKYLDSSVFLEGKIYDNEDIDEDIDENERLYFTDYAHMPEFLEYNTYIREVIIPRDAKVVKYSNSKWMADKIILGRKYHIVDDFDRWYNPRKFNKENLYYLAKSCYMHFDKWFDSETFNYIKGSSYLAYYCSEHFNKWWKKDKFNYRDASWALTEKCSEYFDIWFDKSKFNYYYASVKLARHCKEHFDKWYDEKLFDHYNDSWALAQYCPEYFDKWFNKNVYNFEEDSWALAQHCSEHFDKWFDVRYYNFEKDGDLYLMKYCKQQIINYIDNFDRDKI